MTPTVEWLGLTIAEPATMLTDFAITLTAWWMSYALLVGKQAGESAAVRHWGTAFVFVGAGALLGGISHGFKLYLGDTADLLIWKATVYSVGLSAFFAVAAGIAASGWSARTQKVLAFANVAGLAWYAIWMLSHSAFLYVIYHYVPAMLAVLLMQLYAWVRHRLPAAPWIIAAVVITFIGAAVQQSGIALHRHFNHNDVFHVIQIVSLVFFYQGCKKITKDP